MHIHCWFISAQYFWAARRSKINCKFHPPPFFARVSICAERVNLNSKVHASPTSAKRCSWCKKEAKSCHAQNEIATQYCICMPHAVVVDVVRRSPLQGANYVGTCVRGYVRELRVRPSQPPLSCTQHACVCMYIWCDTHTLHASELREREEGWCCLCLSLSQA